MRRGFPIRISTDQSLLAAPHGFSQRATSFIASQCQGIHQMPLSYLIQDASCSHSRSSKMPSRAQGRTPTTTDRHPAPIRTLPDPGTPTTAIAATGKTRPGPRFTSPLHMSKIRSRPKTKAPPHAPVSSGGTWIMAGKLRTASRGDERRPKASGPEGPGRTAGGGERDRTDDLMLAKHALSQLSYAPEDRLRRSSGSSWGATALRAA